MTQGFDFSNWQGDIPETGIPAEFAYVQMTDGTGFKNPYAPQQVAALKKQGIPVGPYHYLRPDESLQDQLLNFETMVNACGPFELPAAIDCEVNSVNGWAQTASVLAEFATHLESWTNYIPNPNSLLYVDGSFYEALIPHGFPWGRWVWFADPENRQPQLGRLVTQGTPARQGWFGGKQVDPDVFAGTPQQWQRFLNQPVSAPTSPLPPNQPPTTGEPEVYPHELTLPALDGNGNGWYSPAALGLAANTNQIVNLVFVNTDPSTSGYGHVPSSWSIDSDGQIVVEGGAAGGEYGVIIWTTVP